MDSEGASKKRISKSVSSQLKDILDLVRKEPTHLNYWNAYKRTQRLNLKALDIPDEKKIKIALLSSFTIDPLAMYIDIKSRLVGLYPEIYTGPFNQYQQEILDKGSKLYAFKPDVIILAVHAESLLGEDFCSEFVKSSGKEQYQTEIIDQFEKLLSLLTSRTNALTLMNNFIVPSFTPLGILDNKVDMGLKNFFYGLNQRLTDLCRESNQVYVVDLEGVASKHGKASYLNFEMYYRGSFVFGESFLPVIADEYMRYIKALKNLSRKCIVLDLDNVLWGGIIGEDGFDGIKLGKDSPGNAYVDFQRLLLSYYNRGIILAVNSRNNYEDVIKVIREHPYMVLREKHFAAMRVNWQDKVQNMIELAKEININLDTLVFVDDNPREREQMKQALPQVLVVDFPASPFLYRQALENLNDFDALALTEEDKTRGEMYYTRRMRKQLEESMVSMEDFLRSLEMKVVISRADDFSLPRIARLVNKTNQFNLTTRRYTDVEIKKMKENRDEFGIYSLQVIDKFGDEGIVGVAIVRKEPQTWILDSFLMSCRVIGRKVETAFLAKIVADAKKKGVSTIVGEYIPTQKNALVEGFYADNGFEKFQQKGEISSWRLDLKRSTVKMPEWLEVKDE
jgi:FkbH-like protein